MAAKSEKSYAIQKLLVDEANRQDIDPALALAIAKVESDFNPQALSHAGAKGVMQIMPATAENVFGISREQLFDEKINIELGISFIKKLLNRYHQRADIALSHYNGGSAVQGKSGQLSVIPATKKYVNKVLFAREQFKYRAYQLSNSPKKVPLGDNSTLLASVNMVEQKNNALITNANNHAKTIIKPTYLSSARLLDKSLYEKVEQLRSIRLHNIMRNTQSKKVAKNKMQFDHKKRPRIQVISKPSAALMAKRKKVLSWEKIFN